jgi:hypothetical protein
MLNGKIIFINDITNITTQPTTSSMSYDPNERLAHFEKTGTAPTPADFYRMMRYHQTIADKNKR